VSLTFLMPRGGFETRWIVYALLRDNVQHHLEGGCSSQAYAAIHSIAAALGGKRISVPAHQLRDEAGRALDALGERNISELAIGGRTEAAISLAWPPHAVDTRILGDSVLALGLGEPRTLGEVFGTLLRAIVDGTKDATIYDVVEVVDT